MDAAQANKWEAAVRSLLKLARTDPAFLALCRRDPARAFRQAAGFDLPGGLVLRFAEARPGECVVPLPPLLPAGAEGQLSDRELEQVAGGTGALGAIFAVGMVALMIGALIDNYA